MKFLAHARQFVRAQCRAMTGGGAVDKELYCEVAQKLGADRTLTKPFEPSELIATLHSLI